jgi:hypothetical protein
VHKSTKCPFGPAHTHVSASENIKLQMMMSTLEDSLKDEFILKNQLKTINSNSLLGEGNIDITCIDRIEKTASEDLVDTYTIYFTSGSESYFTVTNGAKGDKGDIGIQGDKGDAGIDGRGISSLVVNTEGELIVTYTDETEVNLGRIIGADGNTGAEGATGKSAYEVAQENGYTGTVQEWLDSLKGEQGIQGIQGETGKSAYQSWLDSGYTGTEAEFTVWLKGEKGDAGEKGADGYTPVKGVDYFDGKDGQNGKDGISPIFRILENIWEVSYDNGVTYISTGINAVGPAGKDGEQGPTGKDGISVTKSEINENGELVLTFSDNKTVNVGKVVGADGKNGTNGSDGANGEDGKDGVGVVETEITGDGELVITYTTGKSVNLGKVVGSDGKDGQPGIDGAKGEDGAPGLNGTDGKSAYELWLDLGNSGSEEDFINSLKGESGKEGANGQDGLTTAIKVGETVYEHVDGIINLPEFLTEHQSLEGYAKLTDLRIGEDFTTDITVGHLKVGTEIKATMTFGELLKKILRCDHSWIDANCTTPRICSLCGKTEGEPLGHIEEVMPSKTATCEETGLTEGLRCSRCEEILVKQQIIPALGHNYVSEVINHATCTAEGLRKYTCTRCGDSYEEVIPKLAHQTAIREENRIESDCTNTGSYENITYCIVCGEELSRTLVTIPALGHNYGDWVTTKEPEIEIPGEQTKTCNRCGHVITEEIPALPKPEEPTVYYLGGIGNETQQDSPVSWGELEEAGYAIFNPVTRAAHYVNEIKQNDSREYTNLEGQQTLQWVVTAPLGVDEALSELYEEEITVTEDNKFYPAIVLPNEYTITDWSTDADNVYSLIGEVHAIELSDGYTVYYPELATAAKAYGEQTPVYYITIVKN